MGGGMTAAEKTTMIKQMQNLMVEIFKLDKELSGKDQTNLKSPLLPDGVWGGNTDESYKSILKAYNENNAAPSNMQDALLFLNKVKDFLSATKASAEKKEVAKTEAPAVTQPKPASAITDDQAKAAFRGLLESIQSGRIKLKAGSNTNEFRQRIGRDWGAIIRVYKGPQGVVDAFYGGLALTDSEKDQLVKINKDGFDGTSTVVGKINQKFLEAINTYIKPFGRAIRTEKGMARVFDRRQERQERKQNRANAALKDLWILSKVAQRKEVAKERLVKTAQGQYGYANYYVFGQQIMDVSSTINKLGDDDKSKTMKLLFDSIKTSDIKAKYNFLFGVQNEKFENLDEKDILGILENAIENLKNLSSDQPNNWGRKFYRKSNNVLYEIIAAMENFLNYIKVRSASDSKEPVTKTTTPNTTPRRPTTDLTTLRRLLTTAGHTPGTGTGWASLDSAFRDAVEKFAKIGNKTLGDRWRWVDVAPNVFNTTPDISGAEKLVEALIGQQERIRSSNTETDAGSPATAPAPTAATDGPVAKADVVNGLESLFGQILSKEVKVDQEGADMRRDSKDFRGVIQGLGGARPAAVYCVEYCNFSLEENKEIIAYKDKTLEALAQKIDRSSVLSKIYRLFTDIRKQSRRPFRPGVTQSGLAANVQRWLQGQRQEKGAQASISKSIEIRKMAARKKLGLQS